MGEPKHTPGPWVARGDLLRDQHIAIVTDTYGIAKVWNCENGDYEQNAANARLIAAAPEMLAALKENLRTLEAVRYAVGLGKGQVERMERARAAIAKATGDRP